MRQIMPHRNNIGGSDRSCKCFLPPLRGALWKAFPANRPVRADLVVDSRRMRSNSERYSPDWWLWAVELI